jgi:hypothetical protein
MQPFQSIHLNSLIMKEKFYEVLFRLLKRRRMSAALAAYTACFTLPAFGQQTRGEWSLTGGNESVVFEWSGLDIASIAMEGTDKVIDRPVSPCAITGLTNGQLYRFILNQPETVTETDLLPLVGTWIPVHNEGYSISGSERDSWEGDYPPQEAEVNKLTFLANGTAHAYDIFGLPDRNYGGSWSLNGDVLMFEQRYDDVVYTTSYRVLSLTFSEMVIESLEIISDVDRNGDGVINEDDYSEYYRKTTSRKVSPYISVYGISGEPFAPRNVEVSPHGNGAATVNWTIPPMNDSYSGTSITYMFTVNGVLSDDFTHPPFDPDVRAYMGLARNLPTDDQPYQFQLIAIRYLIAEETAEWVPVIGKSAPVTVTGNEDVAATNIYASGDRLYVNTYREGSLAVYTLSGQLYARRWVGAGAASIPLAKGIYIVTFGDKTKKVSIQ